MNWVPPPDVPMGRKSFVFRSWFFLSLFLCGEGQRLSSISLLDGNDFAGRVCFVTQLPISQKARRWFVGHLDA